MDFDNLYKAAKTFLVFSIGVLIFSFSIKIWTGGDGYCKTSWKAKDYSCIKDEGNRDVELLSVVCCYLPLLLFGQNLQSAFWGHRSTVICQTVT